MKLMSDWGIAHRIFRQGIKNLFGLSCWRRPKTEPVAHFYFGADNPPLAKASESSAGAPEGMDENIPF